MYRALSMKGMTVSLNVAYVTPFDKDDDLYITFERNRNSRLAESLL